MKLPVRYLATLFLVATPAMSEERPNLFPTRDAVVEYQVQGKPNRPPMAVRVHLSAGGHLRADPADLPGYLIVDRATERGLVVMPRQQVVLELPLDEGPAHDLLRSTNLQYVRRGEARVAGETCTEWDMTAPDGGTARACITPDGLVLRGEGRDPRYGSGSIEAVSVAYAPQSQALFRAPENFQRVSIPSLAGPNESGSPR